MNEKSLRFLQRFFRKVGRRFFALDRNIERYLFSHGSERYKAVDFRGRKFWIDTNDFGFSWSLWIEGIYEKGTTLLIENIIKPGQTVLDLGAHMGYYTSIFSDLVGKNGNVFSFEPNPKNFRLLEKNTDFPNVTLVKKAVTNSNGFTKLFLDEQGTLGHTLFSEEGEFIMVETIRLDSYFSHQDYEINFIKMDIEGAEPLAINGMKSLIERDKPEIVVEYKPELWGKSGCSVVETLNYLLDNEYSFYLITNSGGTIPTQNEKLIGTWRNKKEREKQLLSRNIFISMR